MFLPCYAPIRLADKIEAWRQEVVRQTPGPQETDGSEACNAPSSHGMRLRSSTPRVIPSHSLHNRTRRPALTEISLPNHPPKRKASNLRPDSKKRQKTAVKGATKATMSKSHPSKSKPSKGKGRADDDKNYTPGEEDELSQRPRGRPPGRNNTQHSQHFTVQHQMSRVGLSDAPSQGSYASQSRQASRSRHASRSGKRSPEKPPSTPKSVKNVGDELKPDNVVLKFLEKCKPPIYLRTIGQIRARHTTIPDAVNELFDLLDDAPVGATIPFALQKSYDDEASTPLKSKQPPRKLSSLEGISISADDSFCNRQTIQIEPAQICPETSKGKVGGQSQGQSSKDGSSGVGTDGGKELSLKRQVDRVMALRVSWEDEIRLNQGFSVYRLPNLHSVN
ncbi:MAG: hypothetical protein Q9201_002974 [Fulgogasparrea decipioides]